MTNHDPEQPAAEPQPDAAALPADAEQIGSLVFVPNPEYPYPFKVATPPRFWMEETTGALNEAVDAYMNGEKISAEQLNVIKLYLRQYMERAMLSNDANKKLLLSKIDKLKTTADVERYADEISEYGAEVF
ncbi:MAG: hypothetical protein JOZ51_08775 [Chloroflexi bacterium]|nr:hypothetical protein [Chloroflexota bacterium]